MIITLLLVAIIWLLWNIQQNLEESNDRQRNVASNLSKLLQQLNKSDEATQKTKAKTDKTASKPAKKEASVGLNSATKGALRKLPKVGAVVAERIIEARPFSRVNELQNVEGMTENLYQELKDLVNLD